LFQLLAWQKALLKNQKKRLLSKTNPIMVVIGNPPYSGESSNAQYSGNNVYKIEPGGVSYRKEIPSGSTMIM